MLVRAFRLHPYYGLPIGSLSAAAAARLIGESAIRFYSQAAQQDRLFTGTSILPGIRASLRAFPMPDYVASGVPHLDPA